jgi:choline dehydrogenase-like flavoprotein
LVSGVRVDEVLLHRGRAVGVRAIGDGQRLTVRARSVVVACGSLLTPLLRLRSGLGWVSPHLGRNLTIHPAIGVMALFDERIDGANAIPQAHAIEEFHDEGMLFEGVFTPLDIGAASYPVIGPRLIEVLEQYDRLACFGVMIEDSSRGRVRPGPGGRPLITYWLNDHDVARLKRGVEILARVYLAAGSRRILSMVHGVGEITDEADVARLRQRAVSARDFEITAFHPLGTARLGRSPATGVIGPDHQVHGVSGLYVVDGSALPGSPAVNPQLTIMALATRAAEQIAARLA